MTAGDGTTIRCALVGDELLAAQCASIASEQGLQVAVLASSNPLVLESAIESGIATIDMRVADDLAGALAEHDFDVLFSVAYLRLLPDDVLAQAATCINFHDGPLPDYAGLNVTTWAVFNGEREHGVTWHLMTADVDRGDVVLADTFPIDANETAFSLNARCYEAGLASFPEVARRVAGGDLVTTSQPPAPRRAYRRRERPLVTIDPRVPAAELDRGGRALDVGDRVRSTIGAARLVIGDEVYLPRSISLVTEPSGAAAGTIVSIDTDSVRLATIDGDISISGLTTPAGQHLDAVAVFARHGLGAGTTLQSPSDELLTALADLDPALADHELWWWDQLEQAGEATTSPVDNVTDGELAEAQVAGISGLDAAAVVAGVAAWSAGLAGTGEVVIGCTDQQSRAVLSRLAPLAEPAFARIPVAEQHVGGLRATCAERVAAALAHGPLLADLVARDPSVRRHAGRPEIVVHLDATDAADGGHATLEVLHAAADGTVKILTRGAEQARRIADQLGAVLTEMATSDDRRVDALPLVGAADGALLTALNATAVDHDRGLTVDAQFRRQVALTPQAPAATAGGRTLTYADLATAVDRLAGQLDAAAVSVGDTVAIALPRGLDMLCAVLAVLDRGAAYLPLDPDYPADRLAFMLEDSGTRVVVGDPGQPGLASGLVIVDPSSSASPAPRTAGDHDPTDLAYLIYTSGSTGKPKGVQLEHRNVTNFFVAMDRVIGTETPGVWLAVTSLSFDISVLELLWTLTRGFHVVIKSDSGFGSAQPAARSAKQASMSLFYFAASGDQAGDGYRLLLESAAWADKHGFEAVWTPERHFHDFGAPYPNPSVIGAALAATTSNVAIRAGSVVLPLHSPIRVAEEWSVVDNLSHGRVGISFAAGWQPNDFVLNPAAYADARDSLPGLIDTVRRLWRGESVSLPGPIGEVEVSTLPRPVQSELPVWLTSAGSPSTFERAGKLGINLLTHLLGQSVEQLRENIGRYRAAWREAGHDGEGRVTLMLHTFLDEDSERARETARLPLKGYLGTAVGLLKDFASAFPTFANSGGDVDAAFKSLTPDEISQLLDMATDRYLSTSGLFGTVDEAVAMVDTVVGAGVDELACLVDFGIPTDDVLASLDLLGLVHDAVTAEAPEPSTVDESVAGLVAAHGVTHLQCTPSLAAMLVANPPDREALRSVQHLMLGGEALPTALANELRQLLPGRFTNMYGPTETTIWSLTHEITEPITDGVPIGTAIANTTIAVLDAGGRPLPVGVYGELHIGGEGVARGYHARPELTAERFVERDGMGRMYATGDVVRIHPDGYVQFSGRADHQVKIRGHRIELGEIEAVLDSHPAVVQSVVVARGDIEPELYGYCVALADVPITADELRQHVGAVLPQAMVPTTVVMLDAMPLTPNGKVDRKQLPEGPAPAPIVLDVAAGGDGDEALVAGIWAAVLGHAVGLDDNFFEIGGHSLLAVKVFRMVTDAAPAEVRPAIHLTDVFRHPTVRTFAARLSSLKGGDATNQADQPAVATGTDRGAMRRRALARRGASDDS